MGLRYWCMAVICIAKDNYWIHSSASNWYLGSPRTDLNGGNFSVPMLYRELEGKSNAHDMGQSPNSQRTLGLDCSQLDSNVSADIAHKPRNHQCTTLVRICPDVSLKYSPSHRSCACRSCSCIIFLSVSNSTNPGYLNILETTHIEKTYFLWNL